MIMREGILVISSVIILLVTGGLSIFASHLIGEELRFVGIGSAAILEVLAILSLYYPGATPRKN